MKNKKNTSLVKRALAAILLLAIFATGLVAVTAFAGSATDEMTDIKASFDAKYLVQSTAEFTDKYVGRFEYTVYYDTSKGTPTVGYETTTPIIIYTVNHPTAVKTGTDSNVSIIKSMLDRGYVVIVADYLNTSASTEMLACSTQEFRWAITLGKILTFSSYAGAKPWNHFVCPAGCNVLVDAVFWEIDKHSAEGTLEKIVDNWNTDLKTSKPNKGVKWATGNTVDTRKKTTSDVIWYNNIECKDSQVDANGLYTKLKYTVAEKITDCVDPDGSFIDMNLYINIVYPTNPVGEVPVMSLANSSGNPRTSVGTDSAYLRPHSNQFLYEGYANVVFDYLWMPMARNASFGYYDGSSGNTDDHMNYAVMMYNDKLVNTAAMRYLRHISEEKADVKFDLDAFGVYGNSKGGWFNYLGEAILQDELADGNYGSTAEREEAINAALSALVPDRYFDGHHGETRYQEGKTTYTDPVSGFTVKGGEKQPWLTYQSGSMKGQEIISGVQFTNATNGSQEEDMTAGHVPVFVVSNMADDYNAAYSFSLNMHNICRELDIPMLHFELPIGHTLVQGNDMNYNVNSYEMYFKYIAYLLKGEAIDIATVSPMDKAGNTDLNTKIKISFTGIAEKDQVETITVTLGGQAVEGTWESSFGGVTWEFTPTELLAGDSTYVITVPAGFKGKNGAAMTKSYTASFTTKSDKVTELEAEGQYYTFTAPSAFTFGNGYSFRFAVSNDAANKAMLYAVADTSATDGELLGSVNLRGSGTYEIDISDFIAANRGKEVTLLLKGASAKNDAISVLKSDDASIFLTSSNATRKNSVFAQETVKDEKGEDCSAVSVYVNVTTKKPSASNPLSVYYSNPTQILSLKQVMGGITTNAENYGRRFTVGFDIFDTTDRVLLVNLNSMTKREAYGTIDYDNVYFNVSTKAGEWVHVEFTYEVYEPDYGFPSEQTQSLHLSLSPSGDLQQKAYIKGFNVTEQVTDIVVAAAGLAETNDGSGFDYKAPTSDKPVALYNGETKVSEYATLKDAFAAFVSGYTVKLQSDYILDDNGVFSNIGGFAKVNIDLCGYTIYSENKTGALIYDKSTATTATEINISGGNIKLGRAALISFADATAVNKNFDINFNNVNVGFAENSFATELVCASAIKAGATVNADIDFVDCVFDLDDKIHSKDASIIFPAPAANALKVSYGVTGGEIRLDSQRWVSVSDNATLVEFFEDANGYTKLVMPESITKPVSGSYLMKDGYASYLKSSTADFMATYTLACDDNSTRYGVITEDYSSIVDYPFLLFKDGTLVDGYPHLRRATDKAIELLKEDGSTDARVEILMRANIDNAEEVLYNGSFPGTILVDLGGYTLYRSKTIVDARITSATVYDYPSSVIMTNGKISMKSASPVGVTHYLADTTKTKTFNVTFDDIDFMFDASFSASSVNGVVWNFWQNGHNVHSITNLTFKDCGFDLDKYAPASGGKLITVGNAYPDVNIKLLGGEIISNGAAYTFATVDSEDTLTADVGSNGKLPTLKVKTGGNALADNFKSAGGEYTNFTATGTTEGGYDLYALTVNQNVTDYGVIPGANTDSDAYPFLVFQNGAFLSAHGTWKSAVTAARDAVSGNASATATILMRRSYDAIKANDQSTNFNTAKGTIIVDLAGYTLNNVDNYTIDIAVNYNSATYTGYESRIVFKNGTMKNSRNDSSDARPMIAVGHSNSDANKAIKKYSFTFDNVIFEFGTGANSIISEWNHNAQGLENTYIFNDCTIKFDGAASGSKAIGVADGHKKQKSTVIFNGGAIEATDFKGNSYKIVSYNDYDSVIFGKSEVTGKYTTLTTQSTVKDYEHSTTTYNTAEGTRYFVEVADDGTKSTYELLPMTFGSLSAYINQGKNLSVVDYPFYVFLDGEPQSAHTSWSAALEKARGLLAYDDKASSVATIVLRYDYTATAGANFNTARGKIVVDLNGYTLTATKYICDSGVNFNDVTYFGKSTIEFKNGTIVNDREQYENDGVTPKATLPLFGLQHSNGDSTKSKALDFYFTDVTFKFTGNSKYMFSEFDGKTGGSLTLGYYFDNCTVDFTGAPTGARLLDCDDNKNNMTSTVVFADGKIIYPDLTNYKLANMRTDESLTYQRKGGGQYTAIVLPSSVAAPTHTSFIVYNEDGAALTLAKESTTDDSVIYRLGTAVVTEYGEIPFTYANAEDYPFIVFNEKGGFLSADDTFLDITDKYENDGALNYAKNYLKDNVYSNGSYGDNPLAAFILMRRDYTMASNEQYNNIAQIQGTLTIDLGGFTLTAANDRVLIPFAIKPWGGSGDATLFPTELVFENGSIVLNNKGIVSFSAWTGNNKAGTTYPDRGDDFVEGKDVRLKFVGINFSVKGNAETLVSYSKNGDTPNATAFADISYENCVFDLTSAKKTVTLFDKGNGFVHTRVSVLGCEIKAANLDKLVLVGDTDNKGSVTLGRSSDGKLLAITLDKSAAAPVGTYNTALGEAEFKKVSENALTATYRLSVKALSDFKVKTSVSLYSDLRFNIYVTDISSLISLTVNGERYKGAALQGLAKTEIDGTDYYVITVSLPADGALADIALGVEIADGDDTLTGSYTMSLVSYVEAALEADTAAEEEKLLCDILSYVRSAYAYSGKTDAELDGIDALLGAGYDANNAPVIGTAVKPAAGNGVSGATFVLGAVPAVRFYLDGTVTDTSKFSFTAGGRELEFTAGSDKDGDYLEVATLAYVLAGEISYTVEGTSYSGSYNLAAYYESVRDEYTGENKAELTALVERFICYVQSAEAYRASVLN